MTDREVLEWWDWALLSSRGKFVFGPPEDLYALEEMLDRLAGRPVGTSGSASP